MRVIYKYYIEPNMVIQELQLPRQYKILNMGVDGEGRLCFWAIVNPAEERENVKFACVGTGWPIDHILLYKHEYVNTIVQGAYVWHFFKIYDTLGDTIENLREDVRA